MLQKDIGVVVLRPVCDFFLASTVGPAPQRSLFRASRSQEAAQDSDLLGAPGPALP